jgi:hypothetical protein
MSWVLLGAAWLVLGLALAVLIGRSIREADERMADDEPNVVVDPAPADEPPEAEPAVEAEPAAAVERPLPREAPTVPGLPVARPPAGPPASDTPRLAGRASESA